MSYTSRFCHLKDLIKVHICGKGFISIAYVVVKIKIVKVFRIDSALWSGFFLGDFWALPSQILIDLAGILTRGFKILFPIRKTQCLKNLLKFCILAQMWHTQSLQLWSILGPNLPLEKPKILLKTKSSTKTLFFRMSNNKRSISEKNNRILVKLSKKTFLSQNWD